MGYHAAIKNELKKKKKKLQSYETLQIASFSMCEEKWERMHREILEREKKQVLENMDKMEI